jgi:hypothetical protein
MSLALVPYQPYLPGLEVFRPSGRSEFRALDKNGDTFRDRRSGQQWLKSIRGYLSWRAGDDWRALHHEGVRYDSARWEYLDACRLVMDIL